MREKLEKMQDEINHAVEQYNDKTHVWATNQKAAFSTIECCHDDGSSEGEEDQKACTCVRCSAPPHRPSLFVPNAHSVLVPSTVCTTALQSAIAAVFGIMPKTTL